MVSGLYHFVVLLLFFVVVFLLLFFFFVSSFRLALWRGEKDEMAQTSHHSNMSVEKVESRV